MRAAILAALIALVGPAQALEVRTISGVPKGSPYLIDRGGAAPVLMIGIEQAWFQVALREGKFLIDERAGYKPHEPPRVPEDGLPDSIVAVGERDIAEAWLAVPTLRYTHGALGDALEAEVLRVTRRSGGIVEFRLKSNAVFEDLLPRIVDLEKTGRDSVLVVRSRADTGAALVAFRLENGRLLEHASTPVMGTPNRWLNPIGAADLAGDGRVEVALVQTPHLEGLLKIYAFENGHFVEKASRPGFSNHDLGSTQLTLHAIADFNGDKVSDIAVRVQGKKGMAVLSYRGGVLQPVGNVIHDVNVIGPVLAADLDGDGKAELIYALEDGRIIVARF
jgi:hypothetical protein